MDTTEKVSLKKKGLNVINSFLSPTGFEIGRISGGFQDFIPYEVTINAAKKAGLSMGDYIDATFNVPGATQQTIDEMQARGVFEGKIKRVCEIGPGTGRYLEKVLQLCQPESYEVYETSPKWRDRLVREYKVIAQPTDGLSLAHTPARSVDLVHTHKMLYGLQALTIYRYFQEMERIVKINGKIAFDVFTERCLDDEMAQAWIDSGIQDLRALPTSLTPKQYAIDFFTRRGCSFDGSFYIPFKPGITEYLVFTKLPA